MLHQNSKHSISHSTHPCGDKTASPDIPQSGSTLFGTDSRPAAAGLSVRMLALLSMMTALALVLSWVEAILPFQPGLPGVKLGLANLIIVCVLCQMGIRPAILVDAARVLLAGLLFGGPFSTLYSLAGAAASLAAMSLLFWVNHKRKASGKTESFSLCGISMTGGVFHNLGQLVVAILFISNVNLVYYFPVMILSGIAAGILNGIVARLLLFYLPFHRFR
jgi:heptaprenyl diphosphate synthase